MRHAFSSYALLHNAAFFKTALAKGKFPRLKKLDTFIGERAAPSFYFSAPLIMWLVNINKKDREDQGNKKLISPKFRTVFVLKKPRGGSGASRPSQEKIGAMVRIKELFGCCVSDNKLGKEESYKSESGGRGSGKRWVDENYLFFNNNPGKHQKLLTNLDF